MSIEGRSLRAQLKSATAGQHDTLDLAMSDMALTEAGPYAHFLAIQFAARATLERWIAELGDRELPPPPQTPAIAADLHDLGVTPPNPVSALCPDRADAVGLAWVLAGSSMGNRTLLQRRRKLAIAGPQRFLSDERMPEYFKQLLPRISIPLPPSQAEGAIAAAQGAFGVFEKALTQQDIWCTA